VNTNGSFSFTLNQLSGHGDIVVYASTNLADWWAIFTNPPVLGAWQFTDAGATNAWQKYYRAEER
jgi:hypothetical protein